MLEAILTFTGCVVGILGAWLLYRPWAVSIDRQVAEEQAWWEEEGKKLDALKYILNADDAEFVGMDLDGAIRVTREKLEAGVS